MVLRATNVGRLAHLNIFSLILFTSSVDINSFLNVVRLRSQDTLFRFSDTTPSLLLSIPLLSTSSILQPHRRLILQKITGFVLERTIIILLLSLHFSFEKSIAFLDL